MSTIEIKNKLDVLLKQLSSERSFDVAEKITTELVGLLNIKPAERFLVNIPRVDAELTRFQLAPGFARQAAAYELPHEDGKPFDLKLFWIKKASKTNLSWLIGLTPNFEDALSNDYKNIGIDFVVPEACDSITVLLSNRFKVRALELKDHITPTQLEIFAQWAKLSEVEIADQNELKNSLHAKLWESFNFEPINRKFYLELVEHFSILVHHLEKDFERKQSVMFTTRLIGRLLFIWFLKKKSLVNDKIDYFSVSNPEKQKEYYENKLEKLFFEVLNREELERDNGDKLTPYLNGGLFDKSNTDFYGDPKLTFPNGYFNQLFITLNKYNFTVDESSPEFQHVAIDPEMLGRIFESLLAEQIDENTGNSKKKATGAFYTPREVVSYMCEQSLIEYLKTKIPSAPDRDRRIDELVRMPEAIFRDQDQNKRRDWKPYRESIIKALEGTKTESPLTVLDPAVGSGAFPMGMLHLLTKIYSRLDPKFEKDISKLKRNILSRSLYGVDIEQTAIEITRLRAWLSIIVDIPESEKVEPLPNLEFKFVCANTLIPLDNTEQATFTTNNNLKDELITIRDNYFKTSIKVEKEKLQKKYLKLTSQDSFFDNKKTLQLKSYKPFDISSSSEFYDPELMHGVQAFDIVIGNPPYVNVEKIDKSIKDNIKIFKTAFQKYDLYVLFYEKGLDLIKNNGILSYITSNKFLSQGYGYLIRKELLKYSIQYIINFNFDIFDSAVVRTCILQLIKNNKQGQNEIKIIDIENKNDSKKFDNEEYSLINQLIFESTVENNFRINLTDKKILLLKKIEHNTLRIDDICSVNYGLRPSSEKLNLKKKSFIHETNLDLKLKPYFEGKDMGYWLVEKISFLDYRSDVMYNPMFSELFENEKLVGLRTLSDINKLRFVYDNQSLYCNDSVVVLTLWHTFENVEYQTIKRLITQDKLNTSKNYSLKYLQSILNSKMIKFYVNELLYDGTHFYPNHMKQLPIKKVAETGQRVFIDLVDQILTLKKQNKDADTKNLESQIDQLVYKLYDLTPEEIKIVENSSKK